MVGSTVVVRAPTATNLVVVAAARAMSVRAVTHWRIASWRRVEAEARAVDAAAPAAGPAVAYLMAAAEGPHIARFLFPSAVAAAHSPQEAREEQEVTAARWARAASASASAGFNVMVIPGPSAVVVAAATMVAVAAVAAALGAAGRVTRSHLRQRVLAKRCQ